MQAEEPADAKGDGRRVCAMDLKKAIMVEQEELICPIYCAKCLKCIPQTATF